LASLGHPCKFQRVSRLGRVTARHSSSGRQPNCGVEQRAPPIFGRAAITLGIGPHSSYIFSTTTPPSSRRRVVIFFDDDTRDSSSTTSRCFCRRRRTVFLVLVVFVFFGDVYSVIYFNRGVYTLQSGEVDATCVQFGSRGNSPSRRHVCNCTSYRCTDYLTLYNYDACS